MALGWIKENIRASLSLSSKFQCDNGISRVVNSLRAGNLRGFGDNDEYFRNAKRALLQVQRWESDSVFYRTMMGTCLMVHLLCEFEMRSNQVFARSFTHSYVRNLSLSVKIT